ncbi:MAG: hypothetical protein WB795_16285, partial [Candidatus Acidiferrales bacterium]
GAPHQFPVAWQPPAPARSARVAWAVSVPATNSDYQQPLLTSCSPFSFETASVLALARRKLILPAHF